MYIPIGNHMALRDASIIGIFDLDQTSTSKKTREFLARAEREGQVVTVSDDLPKSFILTREFSFDRVYLTQFSSQTLEKRVRAFQESL